MPGSRPRVRTSPPSATPLAALGVGEERVYVDHGLTGTNRARPGLREALAACRSGDMLVVTKLDRLARSLSRRARHRRRAHRQGRRAELGGSVHDPTDPIGRLLFNVLGMVAEFESDLIKMRTKEGLAIARANGKLRGAHPSSAPARRPTSPSCTPPAPAPPLTWPTCSASLAPPSTAPSPAPARPAQLAKRSRTRGPPCQVDRSTEIGAAPGPVGAAVQSAAVSPSGRPAQP